MRMSHQFNEKDFTFQTDLVEAALNEVEFLRTISQLPELNAPENLRRAVYRYEKYWLPLLAKHNDKCLPAPIDIEWVWHCHMLSPAAYFRDCLEILGTVPNHSLIRTSMRKVLLNQSRRLWSETYSEGFEVDFNNPPPPLQDRFSTRCHYDIVNAALRQKSFFYHVSLPHYSDKRFLENALLRYKRFLYLIQQSPKDSVVPCYDIDLLWHSHQLHPHLYKEDMSKILGRHLQHDDTDTDRSPGSKLSRGYQSTSNKWQMIFGESYKSPGTLHRGKATNERICRLAENERLLQFEGYLKLQPGSYKNVSLHEVADVFGERLPNNAGMEQKYLVASHSLVNNEGHVVFTCQMVHSLPRMTSALQVFYDDKMVAEGYDIGSNQLPQPTSVIDRSKCVTLNPTAGERAILIKNTNGDWGVLVRGVGEQDGESGGNQAAGDVGVPQHTLGIRFHKLTSGRRTDLSLSSFPGGSKFHLDAVQGDLNTGVLEVDVNSEDIAESIAAAISLALLHMLFVPRHMDHVAQSSIDSKTKDMSFLDACGQVLRSQGNLLQQEKSTTDVYGGPDTNNLCNCSSQCSSKCSSKCSSECKQCEGDAGLSSSCNGSSNNLPDCSDCSECSKCSGDGVHSFTA